MDIGGKHMKRIAIIIDKKQSVGKASNISAILMGELATRCPEIFTLDVYDQNKVVHSSINYSTVILKSNSSQQILNLVQNIDHSEHVNNIVKIVFSEVGQGLHNRFDEYKNLIAEKSTQATMPVGLIIFGDDEIVRKLTKKYSLMI